MIIDISYISVVVVEPTKRTTRSCSRTTRSSNVPVVAQFGDPQFRVLMEKRICDQKSAGEQDAIFDIPSSTPGDICEMYSTYRPVVIRGGETALSKHGLATPVKSKDLDKDTPKDYITLKFQTNCFRELIRMQYPGGSKQQLRVVYKQDREVGYDNTDCHVIVMRLSVNNMFGSCIFSVF